MASYTAKSNSIATSYNDAMSSYHQASTTTSQANQDSQQLYQQRLSNYKAALASYNSKWSSKPVITQQNGIALVGSIGAPGSINYFKNMGIIVNPAAADIYKGSLLQSVQWNSDTQIIGTSKKADFGKTLSYKDYNGKTQYISEYSPVTDGNGSDFYDITDIVHNNGTITLTNVASDDYGRKYDLKLTFQNTDNAQQHGAYLPSKVIIGPANDKSIEFDYYGGFIADQNKTLNKNGGLNLSNIQFVYHNTDISPDVVVSSIYSDLDYAQNFDTNLGNLLSWTPNNSSISIEGNHFQNEEDENVPDPWHTGYRAKHSDINGFNSAPKGTAITVGSGNNFQYFFHNCNDYNGGEWGYKPGEQNNAAGNEGGIQFNLFGQGASLPTPPTPPTPPSDIPTPSEPPKPAEPVKPAKKPVYRNVAVVSYHSNTVCRKNKKK